MTKWTDDDVLYLKQNYTNYNWNDLIYKLHRNKESIKEKARILGLQPKRIIYDINHNFFDNWSSDMAYILGFIITDGCVLPKYSTLSFGVSIKDKCILDYIAKCICPTKPVLDYKSTSILHIVSPKLLSRLKELGVCERKSGYEVLPSCPVEMKPDLLRGIFDGDGSVHFNYSRGKIENKSAIFDICSASLVFLQDIKEKYIWNYGKIWQASSKNMKVYKLRVQKRAQVREIADYMYNNSKFCLERKKVRFYEVSNLSLRKNRIINHEKETVSSEG